jgi:4-hydroxybenzoate polyprenyltransferase
MCAGNASLSSTLKGKVEQHFAMSTVWTKTKITLEMIKWEHSIFALPFALTGALLAAGGLPPLRTLGWILVAMISARSAAMAFNRWADAALDAANPRTLMRAIPAGQLSRGFVLAFTLLMVGVFELACLELNRLTLELSPIVLLVLLGYSYMKRVTRWSHIVLGLALGIAPSAAWIAVRGSLDPRILLLTAIVTCWVAGFDILYACQDMEHDREAGLFSVPQALGLEAAFWISRLLHLTVVGLLGWFAVLFHFGLAGQGGVVVVTLLLLYEHLLVSPRDLRRLNAAFFTMNGVIAMVFLAFVAADLWFAH